MAVCHLHIEHTIAGKWVDARGLRWLPLIMEQDAPFLRYASNDDSTVHNWMDLVDMVGLESYVEECKGRERGGQIHEQSCYEVRLRFAAQEHILRIISAAID